MTKNYHFRSFYIPARMMAPLEAWVAEGRRPGDFLCAVLENDLLRAAGFADDENLGNLPAYCAWLVNVAPRGCYGSPLIVSKWAARHEAARGGVDTDGDCAVCGLPAGAGHRCPPPFANVAAPDKGGA